MTINSQELNVLSEKNKYDGLKSLLYFLLMAALLCSMLFLPDKIYAGDILFSAQIKNQDKLTGTLSGRFLKDFEASDLYILSYSGSETFARDKLFSLIMVNNDPKSLVWKNQVAMISTYDCLKAGGWGALTEIDFTPLKTQENPEIKDFVFLLVLVRQGGDPLNPSDWHDFAATSLITDPSERAIGQSDFTTTPNNDRYNPALEDDAVVGPPADDADKDNNTVEKPDIYKISGNKLFYANGSAGRFQVVDISKPDTPRIIHSELLDNTPLDLYIINNYVVLLEQMNQSNNVSVVLKVFNIQQDIITKAAEEVYPNMQYSASRKSGSRIFITGTVPYYYAYDTKNEDNDGVDDNNNNSDAADEFIEGSLLAAAVDISNPAAPLLLSKQSMEGYDSDIYLNSSYLVQIARISWDATILYLFDLKNSNPLTKAGEIKIPGRVPSEYHVNIAGNSLFVIYRDQDISKGSSLKIFEIGNAGIDDSNSSAADNNLSLTEKGSVNAIAPGEELFAGTFTEDRAYIVTYERKDPLWVVDISDTSSPKIMGELEVPGWSEYIRFYEDRLIALGYDDSDGKRRVSIALFSVQDPLKPQLLDRVTPLTGVSDYTYSAAIDDDRGFYLNTSSGIIMIPISYYTDANYSGVEIVRINSDWNSFNRDDFVAADFNVQRGTEADETGSSETLKDIALSIGDSALNTINIQPDQKPAIVGGIRLSYNTEKIALYKNDAQEGSTMFAVGGDFYNSGTSDLMSYQSRTNNDIQSENGGFDFTVPSIIKNSELLYPELLIDNNGFAVIFSWSSAAFRLFDQKNMTLGDIVEIGNTSYWTTSDPIITDKYLYFAVSQYQYDIYGDYYSMTTTLKRYDCSNFNSPIELPDISTAGTPKYIYNQTRLISVETYRYYYPYYAYDAKSEDIMPPQDPSDDADNADDTPQGTRINAIELLQDNGILDKTILFDQEKYGYSEVVCDETNIYLIASKDDETTIYLIDPNSFEIGSYYAVKGTYSPVKAYKGKILLTSTWYYPYWRYDYAYMPYSNNRDIKVVDISSGSLSEILSSSKDIYPSQNNTVIDDNGVYIANGYKGVVYLPFTK